MRKKQKINKKKQSQRAYKDFIFLVNWHKNKFDIISHISNIYGNGDKKEVSVYRLPLWRDITLVQKLAYFFHFMAETKDFENIKPFTLDLSKSFRDKHKNLTYKKLKAVIIKKIYGNLDYALQLSNKPMMSFILENKAKDKRKDINDKETHVHGIREVFDENIDVDKIYETIGYKWQSIVSKDKYSELQIVFMNDDKVVCYLYGDINDMDISINFDKSSYKDGVIEIYPNKNDEFKVEKGEEEYQTYLTYISK